MSENGPPSLVVHLVEGMGICLTLVEYITPHLSVIRCGMSTNLVAGPVDPNMTGGSHWVVSLASLPSYAKKTGGRAFLLCCPEVPASQPASQQRVCLLVWVPEA